MKTNLVARNGQSHTLISTSVLGTSSNVNNIPGQRPNAGFELLEEN